MRWERPNRAERSGFTEHDLKICELCGALNPATTHECVICGWRGRFDFDPEAIRRAMDEMRETFAQSNDSFFTDDLTLDEYLGPEGQEPRGLIAWLRKLFGRQ